VNSQENHHVLSYTTLAFILGLLLVLTGITVAVSYLDLGFFNVPVALGIACTKVTFVLLYFMHLKFEGPIINLSFIGTKNFLNKIICFKFLDVAFI
jgi:cytochrome c oxidase subunit 4